MRQVPHYLIIGDGRVARHFQHYFSLLNLSFQTWHRREPVALLSDYMRTVSHVLILVSDSAIDDVAQMLQQFSKEPILLHCSGSLLSAYAYGAHPLMTFGKTLYTLNEYQSIPFVIDEEAPEFSVLFPGLKNSSGRLNPNLKSKYHALCVLSANFSCMLWQKLFKEMEGELNMSPELAHPFLLQQMKNLINDPTSALTGPLVREDGVTIEKNIQALRGDAFQEIYRSFVKCYANIQEEKNENS